MHTNRRKKQVRRRKQQNRIVIAIASLLMVFLISMCINQDLALARDQNLKPHYTSMEIEAGETLWNIAERYKAEEQSTISYIAELKQINDFGSNEISEGDYLIIVDYTAL
jgi:hypothetical protein